MFGDIEVDKHKTHQCKSPILRGINKMIVSKKVLFGKKDIQYFIGYKDGKKFRPLCVILPKLSAYGNDFDKTK